MGAKKINKTVCFAG